MMYAPEAVNGAARCLGRFGAAAPSTLRARGPAQSHQPTKHFNLAISISAELRKCPGTSLIILQAQSSGVQDYPAPKSRADADKRIAPKAGTRFHRRRSARYRVKRRRTSSHTYDDTDASDLALWQEDPAPAVVHSTPSSSISLASRTFTGKNAQGPSGSGPPSGFPLSPATARALARGFRPVDLALASAGPLEVWCGNRSETFHSAPSSSTTTATSTASTTTITTIASERQPPQHQLHPLAGAASALRQQHVASHPLGSEIGGGSGATAAAAAAALGSDPRGGGGRLADGSGNDMLATSTASTTSQTVMSRLGGGIGAGRECAMPGSNSGGGGGVSSGGDGDVDVDVVLLGPSGRPRDLSVLVAAVERLVHRPAGRGRVGCVVVGPSRERVEALQEAAFTLLAERGGGPEAMHVMAIHGGTSFREDVSGLRSQPPDLLLTTPGRMLELLTTDQVQLGHLFESLRVLVFDGAEVLSSRAFRPQVERLLRLLPNAALCTTTASPRRRVPERRGAVAAAAGRTAGGYVSRAVTLVAAAAAANTFASVAEYATAGGGVTSLPAAPVSGARGIGSEGAGPPTTARAAAAAAALRFRAADQLFEVSRPLRTQQPPPATLLARQGLQGTAAPVAASTSGATAAADGSSLQFDLKSLTGLALRSGFATFTLPGNADGGKRTLAAAVATALDGSTWVPPCAVQSGGAVTVPSARGEGATHGSLTQLGPKLSLGPTVASPSAVLMDGGTAASGSPSSRHVPSEVGTVVSPLGAATAPPPPFHHQLVPLHVLAVPYEEHLPYLYVVVRQHMLSEGRHKIVVQFPSAHLANLYARLFQALGFPAACAHSRKGRVGRQEAVRDFSAAHRGLLFCTEMGSGGLDGASCGLTLMVWVGLPRQPGQLVQYMAAVQQAATAAAAAAAATLPTAMASGVAAAAAAQQRQGLRDVRNQGPGIVDATAATGDAAAAKNDTSAVAADANARVPAAREVAAAEGRPPSPSSPPRCLLVLNDVEAPRVVALAAGEALAAAGLGRVVPVQPGAWSGPLEDVSRLVQKALTRVPPDVKLKGLEGLLGHMWATRTSTVAPGTAWGPAVSVSAAGGSGGGGWPSWVALGAGLGPQPEQQLGAWARRFAEAMGLPQPPLLSRHVAARMGLRSIPGVNMVDFHIGRPPPPGTVPTTTTVTPQAPPPPSAGLRLAVRLQLQRQRRREREIQQMINGEQRQLMLQQVKREKEKKRLQQEEERKRQQEEARLKRQERQQLLREERPKLHPPSVIGRYRWFRALKRAQKKVQG